MDMVAHIHTNTSQRPMTTDHDILTLAQWFSPAFPVGAFAYSHGLETAIHAGTITNAQSLQDWLSDVLSFGSGRNDCILLRVAYASESKQMLIATNDAAHAVSASAERLLETQLQGAAFNTTTTAIWGGEQIALCYPVAVGAAAAQNRINVDLTCALYLQAFASNLVSAAVRAVPLGQTDGQSILAALTPICEEIAKETRNATLDDLHSSALLSDIAAMKHETLQPRIFRS